MNREQPKFRRQLSAKQLALLHILYRFRFATTDLIANYQGRGKGSISVIYKSLQRLVDQGYVGCNFAPEYHIRQRPAAYYLLAKGVGALKKRPEFTYSAKAMYNTRWDKTASEQFIDHCLMTFDTYCKLKAQYGDKLQFFTKSDLAAYQNDHFPQPLPDAYIRLEVDGEVKQYFLDLHYQIQPFEASRHITRYMKHADSQKWEGTQTDLPQILAVCDTSTMQKLLQRRMAKDQHPNLNFLLTTRDAVAKIAQSTNIWQRAKTPSELTSLEYA